MPKDNENKQAAAGGDPLNVGEAFKHPAATHDQDEVVVEVVYPDGVKDNGKLYRQGDKFVTKRGLAEAQNKAHARSGRKVFRFVRTLNYVSDPTAVSPAIDYEDSPDHGPIEIG